MSELKYIYNRMFSLSIGILVVALSGSCSIDNDKTYRGRVIELDFSNIEEIKDEAWIEIDGIRYTHFQDFQKPFKDEYSLPASKEVYYIVNENNERIKRYAPVNDFTIAIALGNFIDLAHTKEDTTLARIKINQRYLMHTFGKLVLQRPDSSVFTVKTSDGYPAKITVKSS